MKTKKKLAIVCSTDYKTYPMGGMMSFILDTLPYLQDEFDVVLWGVSINDSSVDTVVVGNKTYPFKVFSKVETGKKLIPNLIRVSINIWKKRHKIINEGYDIIYIHGIPLSFPFLNKKTNKKNIKVINHIHGLTNPFSMSAKRIANNKYAIKLYEKYRNWVVKKSDLILLASDHVGHKQFSDRFPGCIDKIKYVPNFADKSVFSLSDVNKARQLLDIKKNEIILVNTGRISLQKDPFLLVNTFIYLIKSLQFDCRLIMIGDGELRPSIEEYIKKAKIEDKITITGKITRDKINLWLNAADLYVYTSFANGFPIALAESAMCGLPIVTTDVTGVHDLVVDNISGYLVNTRNPEEIAKKIVLALTNREDFSKNILKISRDFGPDEIVGRIVELIKNC